MTDVGLPPLVDLLARAGPGGIDARIADRDEVATCRRWSIPIEERSGDEVTARFPARNPAFDVTPAELVAAIVTEQGIHRTPYAESLAGVVAA